MKSKYSYSGLHSLVLLHSNWYHPHNVHTLTDNRYHRLHRRYRFHQNHLCFLSKEMLQPQLRLQALLRQQDKAYLTYMTALYFVGTHQKSDDKHFPEFSLDNPV
jgi:hypothetical protein